jgi:hypothetical protein
MIGYEMRDTMRDTMRHAMRHAMIGYATLFSGVDGNRESR